MELYHNTMWGIDSAIRSLQDRIFWIYLLWEGFYLSPPANSGQLPRFAGKFAQNIQMIHLSPNSNWKISPDQLGYSEIFKPKDLTRFVKIRFPGFSYSTFCCAAYCLCRVGSWWRLVLLRVAVNTKWQSQPSQTFDSVRLRFTARLLIVHSATYWISLLDVFISHQKPTKFVLHKLLDNNIKKLV